MPGETTGTDIFSIAQGQSTLVEKAIPHDLTISSTARLVRNCDATGLLDVFRSLVREKGERASLNKGRGRGDLKVTIRRDTESDLVCWHASSSPRGNCGISVGERLSRVTATIRERGVGTRGAGRTPDIVVHDQDPVKDLGEPAHIAHGVTITTGKWPDLSGSGDDGLAWQSGPQLLKENEEIGRVAG